MNHRRFACFIAVALAFAFFGFSIQADEGMWLFTDPPRKELKEKYNFEPSKEWLDHLRLSCVRFNGGSASFVSGDGLLLTNHHVGMYAIHKLWTPDRDLLETGFLARSREEELKCSGVELNVLMSVEEVSERIEKALAPFSDPAERARRRRAEMTAIESESFFETGLKSEVVTLYHGGLYHLYRYKVYTDVRLVFAPEESIASFGGDPDNFEYPRCDLDVCFFRVYEDGNPAKTPHYLKWNSTGARDGELVFMAGHPGRTERLKTVKHLEYIRDVEMPAAMDKLRRLEVALLAFSQRNAENARCAGIALRGTQNGRKARLGMLAGLQDPEIMKIKRDEEETLRRAAADDPKMAADFEAALHTIEKTLPAYDKIRVEYEMLEQGEAFHSTLFNYARTLVRMADELSKPNEERLREFRDSNLEALKRGLFTDTPIFPDLESEMLSCSLSMYTERMGYDDPLVRRVMEDCSPSRRAKLLVRGTLLADADVRCGLVEGDAAAVAESNDPMIQLARLVDAPARAARKTYEQAVGEPRNRAYGMLADLRFKLFGESIYPDATGTLRLSFGTVKGYWGDGKWEAPSTTFGRLFYTAEMHQFAPPYSLPKEWIERRGRLDEMAPLNFVSTNDIIGGNSGSPAVNRDGELVGIVFDGNLASLVWDYVYTMKQGRAVSVHAGAIVESLRKIYDADRLADELQHGSL
ncbi:MAG: S46 family peptidase [Pirellulales bacterium]|nr:S46 family peptidase [Pirellulales bacterium]